MTVYSDQSKARYRGNGLSTAFAIPFRFFANADGTSQLGVYVGDSDVPLTEGKDYTVTGAGNTEGGEVVFASAPGNGTDIAIIRSVPQTQEVIFKNEDKFPAEIYEKSLDKLTMEVQEVKENLTRAIVLPPTSDEKPLEARDELLAARTEAAASAAAALASENAAKQSETNAAASQTAAEQAKQDVLGNAGFQAVAADLTGDNKIGYVADNLEEIAASVEAATLAANKAEAAAQDAETVSVQAIADISTAKTAAITDFDANAAEKTESFNANAAEKQQDVNASVAQAAEQAEAAAGSATQAGQSASAAAQSAQAAAGSAASINIPPQTGNDGKLLRTNGTEMYWGDGSFPVITYWE